MRQWTAKPVILPRDILVLMVPLLIRRLYAVTLFSTVEDQWEPYRHWLSHDPVRLPE